MSAMTVQALMAGVSGQTINVQKIQILRLQMFQRSLGTLTIASVRTLPTRTTA
jgi:hypothetical protein